MEVVFFFELIFQVDHPEQPTPSPPHCGSGSGSDIYHVYTSIDLEIPAFTETIPEQSTPKPGPSKMLAGYKDEDYSKYFKEPNE